VRILSGRGPGKLDPRAIYAHAHELLRASDALHKISGENKKLDVLVPALTLDAFSVEIFLKCLIAIETGTAPPRYHNLHKLFMQLSKSTRVRITTFWDWYAQGMEERWTARDIVIGRELPRDLESVLKRGAHAFERLRYHYDKSESYDYYLGAFPYMLNLMALELRPEWGGYPAGWRAPDDFSTPPSVMPIDGSIRVRPF
jgi:HEPN domain-containing protein